MIDIPVAGTVGLVYLYSQHLNMGDGWSRDCCFIRRENAPLSMILNMVVLEIRKEEMRRALPPALLFLLAWIAAGLKTHFLTVCYLLFSFALYCTPHLSC